MAIRNSQNTIKSALLSLIMQSYTNWELLLFDDGSSDSTVSIVKKISDPRISFYADGQNKGLPARLNQAIKLSKGKYFARMDGDDIAYPYRLERQLSYLEYYHEIDLVGAWVMIFDSKGTPLGKRSFPEIHSNICTKPIRGFPIAHPTFFGRTEWFQYYRYNEEFIKAQDQELLLRSYHNSQFANIPEILLGYREEQLNFKKLLTSRKFFVYSVVKYYLAHGKPLQAFHAILEQTIKSGIDYLALSTSLNRQLLKHRTQPITLTEQMQWQNIWQEIR